MFKITRALVGATLLAVSMQPLTATPAKADFIDFWNCWHARGLKGDGRTFTAGCYDLWSPTAPKPVIDRALRDLRNDYLKDQKALEQRYGRTGKAGPKASQANFLKEQKALEQRYFEKAKAIPGIEEKGKATIPGGEKARANPGRK